MTEPKDIDTTLFFRADVAEAFAALPAALIDAFGKTRIQLVPRLTSATDLVMSIDGLTLSLTRMTNALDLDRFQNSNRPEAATTSTLIAHSRLTRHRGAIAMALTGPADLATKETRLGIIYIATMQIVQLVEPEVLHWGHSNTLYTMDEFRSSTGAHRPVKPRRALLPAGTVTPRPPQSQTHPDPRNPNPGTSLRQMFQQNRRRKPLFTPMDTQMQLNEASERVANLRAAFARNALFSLATPAAFAIAAVQIALGLNPA